MSLTSWMMLSATRRGMVPRIHQREPSRVSCELNTDAIVTEEITLLDSLSRPLLFTCSISTLAMQARKTSSIPCLSTASNSLIVSHSIDNELNYLWFVPVAVSRWIEVLQNSVIGSRQTFDAHQGSESRRW